MPEDNHEKITLKQNWNYELFYIPVVPMVSRVEWFHCSNCMSSYVLLSTCLHLMEIKKREDGSVGKKRPWTSLAILAQEHSR